MTDDGWSYILVKTVSCSVSKTSAKRSELIFEHLGHSLDVIGRSLSQLMHNTLFTNRLSTKNKKQTFLAV